MCSDGSVFESKKTPSDHTTQVTGESCACGSRNGPQEIKTAIVRIADDLRPKDSRSWRQPDSPESHATPTYHHRRPTVEAESNSIKFKVGAPRGSRRSGATRDLAIVADVPMYTIRTTQGDSGCLSLVCFHLTAAMKPEGLAQCMPVALATGSE